MEQHDQRIAERLFAEIGDSYTLEGQVGRGGMGIVFAARDLSLQRRVAIKVLPPELAFRSDIRQRFTREAQTAARLQHPHIVPIHTVGEAAEMVYFVMGYVDGESLGQRLRRRTKLPVEEARRIMKETADALGKAHSQSIIHRDIKPDNILLEGPRRRVMVTDFGIAKALEVSSGTGLTGTGVAIGTPSYMSPEQAAAEGDIDARSDLYSLGVVAYEMITGELPFHAPTVPGILMKQITEPPPDILLLRPECPEELAATITRCLEKTADDRLPTAEALRRALESRSAVPYRPRRPQTAPERHARERNSVYPSARTRRPPQPRRIRDRTSSEDRPLPRKAREKETDPGGPSVVRKFRGEFASYVSVNGSLLLLNVVTGLSQPWFLFPAAIWGIGLSLRYGRLWSAGYSWRDVIYRPPASDAVEATGAIASAPLVKQLPEPSTGEFGKFAGQVKQMKSDRDAIVQMYGKLSATEKELLPDITATVDGLYHRAVDLGTTLQQMEGHVDETAVAELDSRISAAQAEAEGADEESEVVRRLKLLERQRGSLVELIRRRADIESQFESCVLAVQNMRFDMLRLRSAGINDVLDDITRATQQARALSIDINAAIGAAGEIKEAIGRHTSLH